IRSLDMTYMQLQDVVARSSLQSFFRVRNKSGYIGEAHYIAQMVGNAVKSTYISIWLNTTGNECEVFLTHALDIFKHAVAGIVEASSIYMCGNSNGVASVHNDLSQALSAVLQNFTKDYCPEWNLDPDIIVFLSDVVYEASLDALTDATKNVAKCPVLLNAADFNISNLQDPKLAAVMSEVLPEAAPDKKSKP
ncbi:hypothetical protein H632_c4224p0, partial [Helicosporidium sp. ATCC 50920]